MEQPASYRAFISYSHRDKRWGAWLHRELETYHLPKAIVGREGAFGPLPARLSPIFRDREELGAATDLSAEIRAALRRSMFLIVICSPASASSYWVNAEIVTFKRLHGEDRVRAVIVGGEPFSGNPSTECFPEALRFQVGDDGTVTDVRAEPIAADLRPNGDGKRYAVSKLVSGLTGARLDELVQRDSLRRARRAGLIGGGASAVAAVMAVLTFFAVSQRDEAREQRTNAEGERAEAVAARNDAEDLIEFMLTDLRTRLEAVGRLDVLDSVGERALAYYDARRLSESNPDALGRRARAQLLVGEIDNRRGDLDAALAAYTAAAATTEAQLKHDPKNPQRIFDHAQSVYWVGYVALKRGNIEEAKRRFAQYDEYAQQLVAIDSESDAWQSELGYANTNLGALAMSQGEASKAETYFRKSLEVKSRLVRKHPEDPARLLAQGEAYAWLADALAGQAELSEARAMRTAEIDSREAALSLSPKQTQIKSQIVVAYFALALIETDSGRPDVAQRYAETAVKHAMQLHALEPNSMEYVQRASRALEALGDARLSGGKLDGAKQSIASSIELAQILVAHDAAVDEWQICLARPKLLMARIDAQQGRIRDAIERFGEVAKALAERVAAGDPATVRTYCRALAGRARLAPDHAGDWAKIVGLLAPSRDGLAGTQGLLAEADEQTHQASEAAAIVARLYHVGYRHPDFLAMLRAHPRLNAIAMTDAKVE